MSIEYINSIMQEGQFYTVEQIANKADISKSYAGECLRSLWRGMVVEREKRKVGETKAGRDRLIFHYITRQKRLELET